MSKQLFELMREQEVANLYPANFTKKEAITTGKNLAKNIIDSGNVSKHTALANLIRLNDVVNNAVNILKDTLKDVKVTEMGCEFIPTNGRKMVQYLEDPIWCELQEAVKQREKLLNLAQTQETADLYGNLVPKVSVKYASDSLTIKY
jgi:hypothetical protein